MIVAGDRVAPRSSAATAAPAPRAEEGFAQALREKGFAPDDTETGDDADRNDGDSGNDPSQASALTCPIAALPGLAAPLSALGCDVGRDGPIADIEATAAATAATAAAAAARSVLAPTENADPTAWEASVRDGSGVAIDMRAEGAPPGAGECAAWSVTVVSPTLAAETLARHAPDLIDRLRRRGIASHVRIDGAFKDRGDTQE